jgi:hypothetical protein
MSEQETTLQEVDRWKALNNVESISVRHGSGSWTVVIKGGSVNYTAISKRLQVAWEAAKREYETRGKGMFKAELELALKARNANRLGQLVDALRAQGVRYLEVVQLAQEVDPTLTLAEWETLMQEADSGGEELIAERTYTP